MALSFMCYNGLEQYVDAGGSANSLISCDLDCNANMKRNSAYGENIGADFHIHNSPLSADWSDYFLGSTVTEGYRGSIYFCLEFFV